MQIPSYKNELRHFAVVIIVNFEHRRNIQDIYHICNANQITDFIYKFGTMIFYLR